MNAASKVKTRGHSEFRSESQGLVFAMKPTIKRVQPIDQPTNRERRERRDMVYIVLRKSGLSPDQIAVACRDAARSPSQIRRRLQIATKGLNRRLAACG